MLFLKKNLLKIFLTTITLAGSAMFIVLLANFNADNYGILRNQALGVEAGSDRYNALGFLFLYISSFIFFTTATVVIFLSIFDVTKHLNKFVMCVCGIVCLTLMLCSALIPLQSDSYALMREIRNGERNHHMLIYVQAEVITRSGESDLAIFAGTPMDDWHMTAESLADLAGMSQADLEALIEALDELKEIINEQTDIAISEAQDRAAYEYLQNTIIRVTSLLLYGSIPLFTGLALIVKGRVKESENV
ncbi:MAG: hypothetical protein FWE45_02890 [Firmicutes bacterium]|nr:hypothetical protein [Bacillota bacterium]